MLIALFTDIHGNREAFEACLDHARRLRAERFVFLGDYVGYGADPRFVVDTVAGLIEEDAIALLGNHDEAIFKAGARMNPLAAAAIDWTRRQLDEAQCAFLRARPLLVEEGERLFVHANAYAPAGWDYMTDRLQAARSMMATACRTTFCGHVHVPAVFHLARGGRPPSSPRCRRWGFRSWRRGSGSPSSGRSGNRATEIPLLAMRFCMTSRAR